MAVGQTIGVLPACFIIDGPGIIPIIVAIILGLTLFVVLIKRTTTMSTAQPQARHFVIATASAAFHGGVTAYMWLGLYAMFAGIAWLLRAIVGWPDVPDVWAAVARPSLYPALPLFIGSLTLTLRELTEQLYPDRAGMQPVFETGALSRRLIWSFTAIVLAAGVVLLGAAALQYQFSVLVALVMQVIVLSGSAPLATLSATEKRPVVREVIDATRRLLEQAGYEVLEAPRTGDASVDPLLADLSLYVRAPGRGAAFAIDIKASTTGQPLDWSAASSLKLKVSALTAVESRDDARETIASITPVLVALTAADDTLREFADDHRVMLFELAPHASATKESFGKALATEVAQQNAALSNAAVRAAGQNVPEMIRAFIAERAPDQALAAGSGGSASGGAVAPA